MTKKVNDISRYEMPKPKPDQEALADLYLDPNFNACAILSQISIKSNTTEGEEVGICPSSAYYALQKANEEIKAGNLEEIELLLSNQIRALDALFSRNLVKAHCTERVDLIKIYSNIAFTAQRQCRTTAEALSDIKNPKPYIQNNKAQYQQVNNGAPEARAHGGNSKQANGLLEDKRNETEWLDTGAPETAGGNDKELEAVEAKHRPKD